MAFPTKRQVPALDAYDVRVHDYDVAAHGVTARDVTAYDVEPGPGQWWPGPGSGCTGRRLGYSKLGPAVRVRLIS